ncbi:MAG: dihydromonapterin reductase [Ketobacteraceae bacterium]|nr:dihydromonapterin reductase [Ketobacteraceae bacterium]
MNSPVLITGVGKRIGLALSRHFLDKGMPVIGTYRSHYSTIDELADKGASLYAVDFYDQPQLDELIAEIRSQHASLRAIIHNASDWLPDDNDLGPAQTLQRMMQIHASVPYQMNHALHDRLLAHRGSFSDIIHISDYVTARGSKKHIAYAASKAALDNLTLSFAAALAPDIKVNTIAPALMRFNEGDTEAYREKALSKALIQKEGGFGEVIAAVEYLLQSEYVTGRTLHLDGGRHLK